MSRRDPVPLPDLDDEAFKARLRPLERTIVPDAKISQEPHARHDQRRLDQNAFPPALNSRNFDIPEYRDTGMPVARSSGVMEAAQRLERLRQARGEKQRFEFVLPVRVGRALAEDARKSGMSATRKLLEIFRDAGLPVLEEDLLDLRKEKRR